MAKLLCRLYRIFAHDHPWRALGAGIYLCRICGRHKVVWAEICPYKVEPEVEGYYLIELCKN